MFSGDLLQFVLKDDVSDVAVMSYEYTPLELREIFDSTTSDDLSCKRGIYRSIFLNDRLEALSWKI